MVSYRLHPGIPDVMNTRKERPVVQEREAWFKKVTYLEANELNQQANHLMIVSSRSMTIDKDVVYHSPSCGGTDRRNMGCLKMRLVAFRLRSPEMPTVGGSVQTPRIR